MSTKPRRFTINLYYHVFNCGVEKRNIYSHPSDYQRFLATLNYYKRDQRVGLGQFLIMKPEDQEKYLKNVDLHPKGVNDLRVKLVAYCLMPNHFHLLLKPERLDGITVFISDISNSYTRYFNSKYERIGGLLQGTFKAKEIDSRESLLQVSRYIHLNPIRSFYTNPNGIFRKPEEYTYSSYKEWVDLEQKTLTDKDEVSSILGTTDDKVTVYKNFIESSLNRNPAKGIEDLLFEA